MVRKVVVDRDVTARAHDGAADFHATAHVLKLPQGLGGHGGCNPNVIGCGNGRQRVELVVHTAE